MNLDDAMHEVGIEDACRSLNLAEIDTANVMASHRHGDGRLLKTILEHGGDYRGYVEAKLEIMTALFGDDRLDP